MTIQSPTVPAAGTTVTFADTLTSPGQAIADVDGAMVFDCLDAWGDPGVVQPDGSCQPGWETVPVTSDPGGSYSVVTTKPNQVVQLWLGMAFTGGGPWTDSADVSVDGATWNAQATITAYGAGGGAGGSTPTPTPAPTPTPTQTSPPTPTPSETPIPVATPGQTPPKTPSSAPTAASTSTPGPGPAAHPSAPAAGSASGASTPSAATPDGTNSSLAHTGSDIVPLATVSAIGLAAGLAFIAFALRRRRSESHR
ncbi:hypothetical protein ACRAWC_01060 [Leifsonia sp. L25]|uniref:hypothetical protein n=1 Tax=Leifsonia sp. L25 TaxID=3423957 RepID=UPI003D6874B7